ncbi:hypothetical protein D3C76_883940 [compost metagenome]
MCPAQGKRSIAAGSRVSTCSALSWRPCTSRPPCGSNTSSACRRLPSVAERPQVGSAGCHWRRWARASCSCTPRLLPSSSCHSSTTTRRSVAKSSRACARVSSKVRLSGVVTSTLGRRRAWRARSALPVSPLRTPTLQGSPSSSSGACKARAVSAARARMGVTHTTCNATGWRPCGRALNARSAASHTA